MKTKYFSVFTAAIIIAVAGIVTSCSDNNADITPTEESEGQYLVMFYGVGGKNLDKYILANILQSLAAGSSDKVKMTYQYRFSHSLQDKGDNYRCIRRFTADENSHLKGTSFSQFITSIRLEHAAELLTSTTMTVDDILFACGFRSSSTFYRLFAERFRCKPVEYRQRKLKSTTI